MKFKKPNKKTIVRFLSLLSALCMLSGCGGNPSPAVSDSGVSEIRDTQTVTEEIPGEEAKYGTETIYDYYDDQYTTKAGEWKVNGGKQRTVQNLSNYNFNEDDYADSEYAGGTDVRTESFVRGMGGTAYHATEGWNISAATQAIDIGNFKELNVTSKRFWGEFISSPGSSLYTYASNLSPSGVLGNTQYKDGTAGTFQFTDTNAAGKLIKAWTEKLINPDARNQLKLTLIGNEYRAYNLNPTTGAYEWSGYDTVTLDRFRNEWCKQRFETIGNLNNLCGTDYKSFSEIYPTEKNPKLFYEFWLFQRENFRNVMRDTIAGVNKTYSDIKWGYAGICDNKDPFGNHLYLDFLDYTSNNLYYNWFKNFHQYSFQLDNLTAWSDNAPVIITELGFTNGFTDESKATAARRYKQNLNLLYMRPRVVGSYVYNYTVSEPDIILNDDTWGMVMPDRTKYPAFDAVAQVYADFKYLDKFYNGASNTPLIAVSNQSVTERLTNHDYISSSLAGLLYSQGVPVQVVPSDDSARFDELEETKLIYNDTYVYQNPDGSGDVGKSLENYMSRGNKILRTVNDAAESLYGVGSAFAASSGGQLQNKYANLTVYASSDGENKELWKVLGDFIHGDFVTGKISATKNRIDENAVRILEVSGYDNGGVYDPTWDIQTQMVYKNGEMYLCVVNISDESIDKIDVTIGVNNGILCNLTPRIMRGDNNVSVYRPERANIPSYIEDPDDSRVEFGTITIENLNTYAYVYVGKAVTE